MDPLHDMPLGVVFLVALLWTPPLLLVHELGHAFTALDLTDGRVVVRLGAGRLLRLRAGRLELALSAWPGFGGSCEYEPGTLKGPARQEAWIAAAGPLTSLFSVVVLAIAAASAMGTLRDVLLVGTGTAAMGFLGSGLPLRYGRGLGGGESDCLVVWRILTGGPPWSSRERRGDAAVARPAFLVLLAFAGVLAFLADPMLALALVGLFAIAGLYHAADTDG
jgi:hypothetical protein